MMKNGTKILISILLLAGLAVAASLAAAVIMLLDGSGGNVAVIPVEGVLLASSPGFGQGVASSETLVGDLERAGEDPRIEAVILLINSPGGSAVASDEIAQAVLALEKPSVAVIREVGASGAYWVASATDHAVANRMSVTGSIGVIGSYLSFGDLLDDWNVTYNRLVSGERKDIGTAWRELSAEEEAYLQGKLDLIHEEFIAAVAENRDLSEAEVRAVADGRWLLGMEALDAGLVDGLGGLDDALDWLNETHAIEATLVRYEHEPTFLDLLSLRADPFGNLQGVSVPMAR